MKLLEYQEQVKNYSTYPIEIAPVYLALTLQHDTGNISNLINNLLNDPNQHEINEKELNRIILSLGDMLKTITEMATVFNVNLDEIASLNLRKHSLLKERKMKNNEEKQ